jgi:integrase
MMETTNTHRPVNCTLAVIDGGLNVKTHPQILATSTKPKLLEQVRQAIRARHYSDKTQEAYVGWIKRFIFFHNKRHPVEMAEAEIALFLNRLATEANVSSSTQNQVLNALLFLYNEVLDKKIGLIQGIVRAKRSRRLPVVLTKEEVNGF